MGFGSNPGMSFGSNRLRMRPGTVGSRAISSMAGPFGRGIQLMMKSSQLTFHESRFQSKQAKAIRRLLFRFGGYTQRVASNKFRHKRMRKWEDKGKVWWNGKPYMSWKYSKPGKAPFPHSEAIPAHIKFSVDVPRRNVIIGPTPRAQHIVKLLEYGGPRTMWLNYKKSKSGRLIMSHRKQDKRKMTIQYKERPFMRPAWRTTVEKRLADFLSDPAIPQSFRNVFSSAAKGSYK